METEQKVKFLVFAGVISAVVFIAGQFITPSPPTVGCLNTNSPYSQKMESQIQELCIFGLGRAEAISGLEAVYRKPGINPDAAVKIVKLGANLAAHHNNPDPWKK